MQPRGLRGEAEVPHTTIESAAQAYAREIFTSVPARRIHLVGHSFGGWLACELSKTLEDSGYSIGTLTLIDSKGPLGCDAPDKDDVSIFSDLVRLYEDMTGATTELSLEILAAQTFDERIESMRQFLVGQGVFGASSCESSIRETIEVFASNVRTSYRPAPSGCRDVALILLNDSNVDLDENFARHDQRREAWREIFPHLVAIRGSGTHMNGLKGVNAASVADIACRALRASAPAVS